MKLATFQSVREYSANFVSERNWQQFHTPVNVALALSGECGELCEIFQWKGPIRTSEISSLLTEKEIVHAGEEMSDVFIYSARLCELCGIDLSHLAYDQLTGGSLGEGYKYDVNVDSYVKWHPLSFDELNHFVGETSPPDSIRQTVLNIHSFSGTICRLFASKSEDESSISLPIWPSADIYQLGSAISSLCIQLGVLARSLNVDLGRCITDKFKKNEAKYPVNLVKGSSAKYTEYIDKISKDSKVVAENE